MNSRTSNLLQQASNYVLLGKLTLALEQYQCLHESEPDETTIINTIGDLYVRLGDRNEALRWYIKLGDTFETHKLFANAIATYKRILKFCPKNPTALQRLAQLSAQLGCAVGARTQIMAHLSMISAKQQEPLPVRGRISDSDPNCHESQLEEQALEAEQPDFRDGLELGVSALDLGMDREMRMEIAEELLLAR